MATEVNHQQLIQDDQEGSTEEKTCSNSCTENAGTQNSSLPSDRTAATPAPVLATDDAETAVAKGAGVIKSPINNKDEQQQFKLPIAKDSSLVSSQGSNNECISQQQPKPLAVTKHHSTIEMPTAQSLETKPHSLKRKTSVFSHSGFMGIHKLDQAAIQQHPIVAKCSATTPSAAPTVVAAAAETTTTASDKPINVHIDDQQVENKSQQQQLQQNTSPRRSNRSDTLGSTGSSRASSCDEPTIVSPSKLFAPTTLIQTPQQQQHQQHQKSLIDLKQIPTNKSSAISPNGSPNTTPSRLSPPSTTNSKQSVESSPSKALETNPTKPTPSDEAAFEVLKELPKQVNQEDSSSSDDDEQEGEEEDDEEDDDVVFMADNNFSAEKYPSDLKIPPFESIKTQLKRNSIPNAQDIKRHIDNLISRNKEIIENRNQVSIRSYNSSSQSNNSSNNNNPATGTNNCNSNGNNNNSNRRPSKRWSTTSIGKAITMNTLERKCSQDQTARRVKQYQVNDFQHLHHQQQVPFDNQTATDFQQACLPAYSKYQLRPPHHQQQHMSLSMPTSPKQSSNSLSETKNFLQDKFRGCADLPLDQSLHQSSVLGLPPPSHRSSLSIETAIRNLSLKKHDDHQMQLNHHQHQQQPGLETLNQFNHRDDIVMAALMVERQRQQRLLEDYLRTEANQASALQDEHQFNPERIFSHFQQQQQQHQQQQQQLIEQQLALNRLAAIENELQQHQQRQQLAASLMVDSLRNQQQQQHQNQQQQHLSPTDQQLFQQYDCLTANHALENQLLNEYISKIVLSREEIYKSQSRGLANNTSNTLPQPQHLTPIKQSSPSSPSKLYLGHGTEMLTQSLDSATPSHRCEACDISFWTRDLLNYHTMTSCSVRRGPAPNKPIAFNFNQPNGFDTPTSSSQGQKQSIVSSNNLLQSPTVFISHAPDNCHTSQSSCLPKNEQLQSKSVSPARRRTHNELDMLCPQQLPTNLRQPKRQSTSSIFNQHPLYESRLSELNDKSSSRPRSPYNAREPVNFVLQKKLDPALASILNQHKQYVTVSGEESNLPIKKRKISEPNMRY